MSYLKVIGNKYFRSEYIWGVIILIVLKWLGFLNETIILTLIAAMFTSKGLTDFKKTDSEKNKNIIYGISSNNLGSGNYASKEDAKKEFRN